MSYRTSLMSSAPVVTAALCEIVVALPAPCELVPFDLVDIAAGPLQVPYETSLFALDDVAPWLCAAFYEPALVDAASWPLIVVSEALALHDVLCPFALALLGLAHSCESVLGAQSPDELVRLASSEAFLEAALPGELSVGENRRFVQRVPAPVATVLRTAADDPIHIAVVVAASAAPKRVAV